MASTARFMIARALNGTQVTPLFQTESGNTGRNATLELINSLVFAETKSVRTSTIILAVFNILASAATAASILYDCYWASKRCNPKFKASKFCVSSIHPAETFPLVLAIGIVIQGIIFAVAQAQGLNGLFVKDCSTIAQFMWPAIMIVPYIQLVFGLECTLRSLRKISFQARGKYDVTMCCGTILLMLIGTWIPSHIHPEHNLCFASLLWFISDYGEAGLIILSTVGGLLSISAVTIFARLSSVTMIDEHQRIAASRMVYYLVLGIVTLAFVIPYFVSQALDHGSVKGGMIANVVLNLSGLMSGLLHLFLRSNTAITAFGPKNERHLNRDKHQIRIWGPNELAFGNHLVGPVPGPRSPVRDLESRPDSQASLVGFEKGRIISMESLNTTSSFSPKFNPPTSKLNAMNLNAKSPTVPEPTAEPPSATRGHARNQSYSLFPTETASSTKGPQQNPRPAESVYDISDLAPPAAISGPGGSRHHRDSSIASSATVQIGLRLSHAPEPSMQYAPTIPLPRTAYGALPTTTFKSNPTVPTASTPLSTFNAIRPSPLKFQTQESPKSPSSLNTNATSPIKSSPTLASINKLLPPTPKILASVIRDSNTQLSPAVYSPEKKITGPSSAVTTPQSATIPVNPLRNNPLGNGSPTRVIRSNSGRTPAPAQGKSDWI